MEVVATAIIVFFATFSLTEKYLEPWVNNKVEQYYEAKEQYMAWVLVALFIFDGEPMIMSVYQDKNGNNFGGTIHKNDGKSHVNLVSHIQEPEYIGKVKIYL